MPIAPIETADLQIERLLSDYANQRRDPTQVLRQVVAHAARFEHKHVWIERLDERQVLAQLEAAETRRAAGERLPLFGIPYAVKDNIDVAALPTTAACPGFAYVSERSATCVERLEQAGAILIGKTNLDQFATGLVGTRSPYGVCSSAFDDDYISGGSSSGSGLAVALGMVSFALGTDTAGSGRVPAGFNNVVGLKPTRGWVSAKGVVPACKSLDCVSVFAGNVGDAWLVLGQMTGEDPNDPFSRSAPPTAGALRRHPQAFGFGVPRADQLEFYGDDESRAAFASVVEQLRALGGTPHEIDLAPFLEAAKLLYSGPWVAERTAAVGSYVQADAAGLDPTVRQIIAAGSEHRATAVYQAQWRLAELRKLTAPTFESIKLLLVPTAPSQYRVDEVVANPVELNSRLGHYTNFVNLLDLCGIAVPTGFKSNGLPFGATLLAPAFHDAQLAVIARDLHDRQQARVGNTHNAVHESTLVAHPGSLPLVELAVVGAHLRGEPLHFQLQELDAEFLEATQTARSYQLYSLQNTTPAKPGLARVARGGTQVEVEVYGLCRAAFGRFTEQVPHPMCIGNVELADGRWVKGFLCEGLAIEQAENISQYGGWRAYLARSRG